MASPFISVIIPTLNEEKYIEKTLKNVLNQTFKDFELIVVDGKSQDRTVQIAKKYSKVLIAPVRGIANNLNFAFGHAKGKYVCFLDADTIIEPYALEKIYETVKYDPRIVAGSCLYRFASKSRIYKIISSFILFLNKLMMASGTFYFNKSDALKKINGFSNKYVMHDVDLFTRIRKLGKIKFIYNSFFLTSQRRFEKYGLYRTVFKFAILILMARLQLKFLERLGVGLVHGKF